MRGIFQCLGGIGPGLGFRAYLCFVVDGLQMCPVTKPHTMATLVEVKSKGQKKQENQEQPPRFIPKQAHLYDLTDPSSCRRAAT